MHRRWIIAMLASALAWFASASSTLPHTNARDGFETERAAADKELISGLESFVEWCSSKKIWIERNRGLEAILVIDPGNMSAKRGLGWQQVADGVWEPPKDPKPAKNFDPGALKESPARFVEAIRPWRERLLQLLETHKAELTLSQRDSVYTEILAIEPDNALVREARGEEHIDKGWVLRETVRAKIRRTEIKTIVKEALANAAQAQDISPNAGDKIFKVDWKVAVSTDRVRVLSNGDRDEAAHVASVLYATRDVFQKVFETKTDLGGEFTIYLLCDEAARATFIENLPGVSASQKSFYAQLGGTGLQGSNSAAWWTATPDRRIDGVTRHAFSAMFQAEFNLTVENAWAWEGLGLYLTREMVGSRLTWYAVPPPEHQTSATKHGGADWMKKLLTPGTNWMNEGYQLIRAGDGASLTATLTRTLNKMTPQDLFVSYDVAAFLLETEAQRLTSVLRQLGGGKNKAGQKVTAVFQNALATDIETFDRRLERWLGERR